MKKLFLTLSLLFAAAFAPQSQALEISVAPKSLKSSANVAGFYDHSTGHAAIVLVGDIAEEIAWSAGITIIRATEMLVVTGNEVDSLIRQFMRGVGSGTELVIIHSTDFARAALDLTTGAISKGVEVVEMGSERLSQAVIGTLQFCVDAASSTVTLIHNGGVKVAKGGARLFVGAFELLGNLLRALTGQN